MLIRTPVLALTLLAAATTSARADDREIDGEIDADEIARNVIRTVRRSIALGPTLGGFSAYAPSPAEFDGGLSFGLELELFQSRLPTPGRIRELVRQKTQEKLVKIIRDRFAGQSPDPATQRQLLREIAEEVKDEVLADLAGKPRLLERPRLALLIEANYLLGSADWLSRLGGAFGIGPLSIGPTFSVRFGDDTVARLGAELSLHLLPTKSSRSPVLDIFLRGDLELHARGTNDDQFGLGLRVLLDLI
jgi:hypothetical protein